jgi:hypothetical protein
MYNTQHNTLPDTLETVQEHPWRLPLQYLDDELAQIARRVPPYPPERASGSRPVTEYRPGVAHVQPRLEYKYLVPAGLLPRLRRAIAPFVETDAHAVAYGARGYTVRSIYFDTCTLDFYHQKLAGLETRKKLRLRGYNGGGEDSIVFLEIKRKRALCVAKNRAPVEYAHAPDLFASGDVARYVLARPDCPQALEDARRFFFYLRRDALRPVVLVAYEREAYHARFDLSLRITFDKNLRGAARPTLDALFGEERMRHALARYFIMEVKFHGRFPAWLRPIVGSLGLRPEAISKYVICIDEQGVSRSRPSAILTLNALHLSNI